MNRFYTLHRDYLRGYIGDNILGVIKGILGV